MRLALIGVALLALFPSNSAATPGGDRRADLAYEAETMFGLATYRLWAGRAPSATADTPAETPMLTVFRPRAGTANGTAIVIVPGGAYTHLAGWHEGSQVAGWFASRGVTAFVLRYRVGDRAPLPIPLLYGKRAMRFVRSNAARFGIARPSSASPVKSSARAADGSGIINMAIFGGAVVPLLTGMLADMGGSLALAFALPALCYTVIDGYGFYARLPAA